MALNPASKDLELFVDWCYAVNCFGGDYLDRDLLEKIEVEIEALKGAGAKTGNGQDGGGSAPKEEEDV